MFDSRFDSSEIPEISRAAQRHSGCSFDSHDFGKPATITHTPAPPRANTGARRMHGFIVVSDTGCMAAGGWGGIRTPGGREPTPVFKTGALNHSATHPCFEVKLLVNSYRRTKRILSTKPADHNLAGPGFIVMARSAASAASL